MVLGIVVDVCNVVNPGTNRTSTGVVGDYNFGGGVIKQKVLNICSIKVAPPVKTLPAPVPHVLPPPPPVVPPPTQIVPPPTPAAPPSPPVVVPAPALVNPP